MHEIKKIINDDFETLNQLLQTAKLPEVDVNDKNGQYFKITDQKGNIAGAIGLEVYGNSGLLRSLVVNETHRNNGIAKALVENLLFYSRSIGLKKLVLLTTTADKYFSKHHFIRIQREDAPEEIKQSREFSSVCPVSAVLMYIDL